MSHRLPPVRDLGIYLDSDVSMRSHVAKTVSACYSALRQLRSVRRSLSRSVLQSLVSSLVLSRLDTAMPCSLAGIPSYRLPSSAALVSHDAGSVVLTVFFVEVRPHHSAPSATGLAESPMQSGSSSSSLLWCTIFCTGRHRLASPVSSSARPIPKLGDDCAPLPHHR